MALVINGMERHFSFKRSNETVNLSDPNPADLPEAVMSYYANMYPELTTATVFGPEIKNDIVIYEFKTTIGTKG